MDKCYICETEGETLYPLQSCRHVFCRVCIVKVLGNTISALQKGERQNFFGVSCPVRECSGFLNRQDVCSTAGFSAVNYLDNQLLRTENWNKGLNDMSYRIHVLQQVFEDFIASKHKDEMDICCIEFIAPKWFSFFRKMMKKDGSKLGRVLQELTEVFVTLDSSSYACTFFLCVHSPLRNVLCKFMENDSILEISNHPYVYNEVFNLLEHFSARPELFPLLCSVDDTSDFWLHKEFQKGSVMGLFQKLYSQALFISNSKQLQSDELVSRCKEVFEKLDCSIRHWKSELALHPWFLDADEFFNERFPGVLPTHAVTQSSTAAEIVEDMKVVYVKALKSMQFDQAKLDNHYFRLLEFVNDNRRTRRISKEIAALVDSLPLEYTSSIHIRFDEDRMDLLRALIVGPQDTPYENGIFMFDILLGENYPAGPPQLHFLTTGGGTVRFNPNLYKNEMVCLSIINTWFGPQWKPGASTVLQMLCSLQALVFVSEPYYNEPAYSVRTNCSASTDYNQVQRYNTLMHSILPALKQPDVAFAELIQSHFKLKRRCIEEQCDRWLAESHGHPNDIQSAAEMVKRELAAKFG